MFARAKGLAIGTPVAFQRPATLLLVLSVALSGCALGRWVRPPHGAARPVVKFDTTWSDSEPIGKVGLLSLTSLNGLPRASGMSGRVQGFVVSHPALPPPLTVSRNGREVPVLSFDLTMVVADSTGRVGIERMVGYGRLTVFFNGEGASFSTSDRDGETHGEVIEVDEVRFEAEFDWDLTLFLIRMTEIATASHQFNFRGRTLETPVGRTAQDIVYAEYSPRLNALAVSSASTTSLLGPEGEFLAVSGRGRY